PETKHEEVRDAFITLALEMMLGHPENVIAQRLHVLGSVFGDLESLDKPLVGIPSVVGGCAAQTYAFAFEHMASIERREIANHGQPPSLRTYVHLSKDCPRRAGSSRAALSIPRIPRRSKEAGAEELTLTTNAAMILKTLQALHTLSRWERGGVEGERGSPAPS